MRKMSEKYQGCKINALMNALKELIANKKLMQLKILMLAKNYTRQRCQQ